MKKLIAISLVMAIMSPGLGFADSTLKYSADPGYVSYRNINWLLTIDIFQGNENVGEFHMYDQNNFSGSGPLEQGVDPKAAVKIQLVFCDNTGLHPCSPYCFEYPFSSLEGTTFFLPQIPLPDADFNIDGWQKGSCK